MLSSHEQRAWQEIRRRYAAEAEEPDRGGRSPTRPWTRDLRGSTGVSAVAVGGVGIGIMFVLVGAPVAGLAIAGAAALGWLLWRFGPDVGRACTTACLPMLGGIAAAAEAAHSPADDRRPAADDLLGDHGRKEV